MRSSRIFGAAATLAGLLLGAAAMAGPANAAPAGPAAVRPASSAFVEVVNDHAGRCVDVPNSSTAPNVSLQEFECNGTGAQGWAPVNVGNGFFLLQNKTSGFCMTAGPNLGDRVFQSGCDAGNTLQQWTHATDSLSPAQQFLKTGNGSCLALNPNTSANGTAIVTTQCSDTSAKLWHFALQ